MRSSSPTHSRDIKRGPLVALLILSSCWWLATSEANAQTPPPPGVGIYLSNGLVGTAHYVGDGNASYATGPGLTIYSSGGLQIDPRNGTFFSLTSSPTMPQGLTAGTLSSIASSGPYVGGYATVSTTADLAGGVLRAGVVAFTTGVPNPTAPTNGRGLATSFMQDNLTFHVASGSTADITVTAHLDGSFGINDPYYGSAGQSMSVNLGGAAFSEIGGESEANGFSSYHGHNGGSGYGTPYGWASYSFSNETPAGFDFTGVLSVSDLERTRVSLGLNLDCSGANCEFMHTGTIGLVLPDGVTFSSDSGVFLTANTVTAPVPEPETWALMLAGLGIITTVTRRRKTK